MTRSLRVPMILLVLVAFFLASDVPARASIPSGTQVVLIFVAVGAVGAAIGVGIYYAARRSPTLTGCAVSGPNGLTLTTDGDQKSFALIGDVAGIRTGERVRLKGKRKKSASGQPTFLVDQMTKDFGACKALATP